MKTVTLRFLKDYYAADSKQVNKRPNEDLCSEVRVCGSSIIATHPRTGVRFEFLTTSSAPGPGGAA